jgi:hypothetical protein
MGPLAVTHAAVAASGGNEAAASVGPNLAIMPEPHHPPAAQTDGLVAAAPPVAVPGVAVVAGLAPQGGDAAAKSSDVAALDLVVGTAEQAVALAAANAGPAGDDSATTAHVATPGLAGGTTEELAPAASAPVATPELLMSKADVAQSTLHAMALLATSSEAHAAWPRRLFSDMRANKLVSPSTLRFTRYWPRSGHVALML